MLDFATNDAQKVTLADIVDKFLKLRTTLSQNNMNILFREILRENTVQSFK